ncbi:hypothetical protein SKAU_G00324020 [Synaphobranchus kaupii]|uniref:Uncharacterized protein n=1 Tax=Synaphobranchus kaupii TaxID=118154 RepID=A0A9Q1EPC5_SYNKA|nr:hypothetical protein SKAU_G00324020 [Synaphobranchus kaupii]
MPVHMRTAAWWIFRARFAADLTVSLSLGPRAAGFPGSRTLHFQAEAHRYAERGPAETTRVTATGLSSLRTGLGASALSFCKRITTSSTTMSDSMAQRLVWVDLECWQAPLWAAPALGLCCTGVTPLPSPPLPSLGQPAPQHASIPPPLPLKGAAATLFNARPRKEYARAA